MVVDGSDGSPPPHWPPLPPLPPLGTTTVGFPPPPESEVKGRGKRLRALRLGSYVFLILNNRNLHGGARLVILGAARSSMVVEMEKSGDRENHCRDSHWSLAVALHRPKDFDDLERLHLECSATRGPWMTMPSSKTAALILDTGTHDDESLTYIHRQP